MTQKNAVDLCVTNGIAVVTINNPPVNAISQQVRAGLAHAVATIAADPNVIAVVLQGAGESFVAGAELSELGKTPQPPMLPDIVAAIEASPVPWVAALKGNALGGGLELALACHGRVAAQGTKLGFPEVHVGIIPGAGGTVRLPRLIPLEEAVAMITTGKPVSADKALAIGLIDRIAKDAAEPEALALARDLAAAGRPKALMAQAPRVSGVPFDWAAAEARLQARSRGQAAPIEALQALRASIENPPDIALVQERERFLRLGKSDQAAALRYQFFAERRVGAAVRTAKATPVSLNCVGVVGGGTMGAGIAAALLLAGSRVVLVERDAAGCDAARTRVQDILDASRRRGVLDDAGHSAACDCLTATPDYAQLAPCPLVIEAAFEDMAVKQEIFATLDAVVAANAVLATNTSYLDVAELALRTAHPARVIGLHFFSPAYIMKLLEVVRTDQTGAVALATAGALARHLRKTPVVARVCDGFIGNRIMSAYRRECDAMLLEGAMPAQIDRAMLDYGFAMGIYAVQDMAGLDVAWAMRKRRAEAASTPGDPISRIADRICEAGRFGRKTGAGWYRYKNGHARPDPWIADLIRDESDRQGVVRKTFLDAQIIERLLNVMQTEAAAVLADGIAESGEDIDITMVLGFGFPRHKGGPVFQSLRGL